MVSTIFMVRHGQASFGGETYDRLSPRGHEYTDNNIAELLDRRYRTLTALERGRRPRHRPKPFRPFDRDRFRRALIAMLNATRE